MSNANPAALAAQHKPTKPSTELAIERNLTEIELLDSILESRLGGDINLYRDLLTDNNVLGTWQQRQTALVKLERQVLPHDPDNPADVEAAEFVQAQLARINFEQIIKAMHWGVFYGYAVGEIMWGIEDGRVVLDDIKVRDRGKFKFDLKQQLLYTGNGAQELMPEQKFWTFSAGGDVTDNPYGLGLAHFLYWPVLFKKSNVKFWLIGNEKAASSVPHGQFDPRSPTAERDKELLLRALSAIKNGAATVTPTGSVIELLKGEAGSADYKTLCQYMDEMIALVVLGQVMTSQAVGGQYKAEVQDSVKDDIVAADADLLCAAFNSSIAKWLTQWNFPNAKPPKLWLLTKESKDTATLAATFAKLAALGYRPTIDYVQEVFGGQWEEMPQGLALPDAADKQNSLDYAEPPATDPLDDMSEQLAAQIAPKGEEWIERISQELAASATLLQFRERLDGLAEQLSLDDYAKVFAKASAAARLLGRSSVKDEAKHG